MDDLKKTNNQLSIEEVKKKQVMAHVKPKVNHSHIRRWVFTLKIRMILIILFRMHKFGTQYGRLGDSTRGLHLNALKGKKMSGIFDIVKLKRLINK